MISFKDFGKIDGRVAKLYTIQNGQYSLSVTDYGAAIVAINVPDKDNVIRDVVIGYNSVENYKGCRQYYGGTIGRFANRIEGGKFKIGDIEYTVPANNGPNALHGGPEGFNNRFFEVEINGEELKMSLLSPDGDQGFPGDLEFSVTFTMSADGELGILYEGVSNKDTLMNFTNHAYFNLGGFDSEYGIGELYLGINAECYCGADKGCLADGRILPTRNTPMDFRTPALLSTRLKSRFKDIKMFGGFDHNFILSMTANKKLIPAATLYSPRTGIFMECLTDQPAVQLYTNTKIKVESAKGVQKKRYEALCLETQIFPNCTSFGYFPGAVVKKGKKYTTKTVYKFSVK